MSKHVLYKYELYFIWIYVTYRNVLCQNICSHDKKHMLTHKNMMFCVRNNDIYENW